MENPKETPKETSKIRFNVEQDVAENLNLNDATGEAQKAENPSPKSPIDFNIDDVLPFVEGFLGSLVGKKEESSDKTVNNNDYSSNECTKNVHFTFNFGDVRIHTAK